MMQASVSSPKKLCVHASLHTMCACITRPICNPGWPGEMTRGNDQGKCAFSPSTTDTYLSLADVLDGAIGCSPCNPEAVHCEVRADDKDRGLKWCLKFEARSGKAFILLLLLFILRSRFFTHPICRSAYKNWILF